MDLLIARLLHIGAAVIWTGIGIGFARYVEPSANAIGPAGQSFYQEMERRGFTRFVASVAGTAILAGLYLYWVDSGGLRQEWLKSPFGTVITVGAISAIVAFALGPMFYIPAARRIQSITKAAGPSGPTTGQRAELAALVHRLGRVGRWTAVLLGISLLCMAGARYVEAIVPR